MRSCQAPFSENLAGGSTPPQQKMGGGRGGGGAHYVSAIFSAGIYLVKTNNGNTRTMCEICSKLTIKIPEQSHWHRSGVFIVNFKQISHNVRVYIVDFEQVNANWDSEPHWTTVQLVITFLCRMSFQLMSPKNSWAITSSASRTPPPSLW